MKQTEWLVLLAILLAGTTLRVADLAQIPPGLYHDEAYSGLDALTVLEGAGFPIFFEGNGGREPFFIYLHSVSLLLFGANPFALRIAAAFVGILTLPIFFVLVRAMNTGSKNSIWLALIATAGLATSYWHLNFSRVGWRTISLPLGACLTFYFFWRSRRTGGLYDYLLSGVFLGASLYTYLAARFLPLVIAGFWLIELKSLTLFRSAHSSQWRAWAQSVIPVIAAAIAVFVPLGVYFLHHLPALLFRISDVTLVSEGNPFQAVLSNGVLVAQMFYLKGDPEWRHGIASRPVLDWIVGIPFAVGLLFALTRWRQPQSRFAFLWFGIMLLPTVLSRDAPDTQRAIGAAPAIFLFAAWGLYGIIEFTTMRVRVSSIRLFLPATALVLFGSGLVTYRDYFVIWAKDRHAYYDFQGDLADLARWANTQAENIILPMPVYANPTVHFLTLQRYKTTRSILNLQDAERNELAAAPSTALVPLNVTGGTFALLRDESVIVLDSGVIDRAILENRDQRIWQDRWGKTLAAIVPLTTNEVTQIVRPPSFVPYTADFDHRLNLVGYNLDRRIIPGKPFEVTLFWQNQKYMQQEIKVFVHLLDDDGRVTAGVDEPPFNEHPSLLPRDEMFPDHHILSTPTRLPPGRYSLEVGVYAPADDSRLPVWLNGVRMPDDRIVIPSLKVALGTSANAVSMQPLSIRLGDSISLTGANVSKEKLKGGESFQLTLFWRSLRRVDRDYTVFVHLIDATGKIIAQADHQPRSGTYPTSIWDEGEEIQDEVTIAVPANAPIGNVKIAVGLYDLNTGQRLPVASTNDRTDRDQITLNLPVEILSEQ